MHLVCAAVTPPKPALSNNLKVEVGPFVQFAHFCSIFMAIEAGARQTKFELVAHPFAVAKAMSRLCVDIR